MSAMSLLLFLILLHQVQSVDKVISLTNIDASYVISGYLFQTYTNIIVENKDNSRGLIWVISTAIGATQPQARIVDETGNYSAVPASGYFGPGKLTLSLGADRNRNFVIHFLRTDETKRNAVFPYDTGITSVSANSKTMGVMASDSGPMMYTFVSSDFTAFPQMECLVGEAQTKDCTVDMYLGGMPSEAGKEKYRLASFTRDSVARYRTSYIYGYGVTFLVPAGCDAGYACMGSNALPPETRPDENSMGFFMSSQYPGVFNTEWSGTILTSQLQSWTSPSNITFTVQSVDPGKTGYLAITLGQSATGELKNFTEITTTPTTLSSVANRFMISWQPSDDVKYGYLARWSTYLANSPTGTTTTTTTTSRSTTTKSTSLTNLINSFISLLFVTFIRQ